jgi:Cd2+/Zn2+-exporting ATPase
MLVQHGPDLVGILALADRSRKGLREVFAHLKDLGFRKLVMLTGDNPEAARRVGEELGMTDVRAGLLPEEKLAAVRELEEGYGSILMIGDGINDAPALAAAAVGVAMGGAGTAAALETADVALMADDLEKLPYAVGLSRASRRVIVQNLVIALGVIGVLILSSVLGWLALSWAVVLHEGSSLAVVLNALRLLGYKEE